MKMIKNPKTMYRFASVLSVVLAVCLVCGSYLVKYQVEGSLPELEAAASKYTEKNMTILKTAEVPENTRSEDHGLYGVENSLLAGGFLVAICESDIIGETQWTGAVLFEKGLNGKYRVVESTLTTLPWPVEAESMNDSSFGMFGGDDNVGRALLVLWSDDYPAEMAGYQVTYYDIEQYQADGTIVPLTLDVPVEPGSTVHMTCVNIPFNYFDRDFFAYDEEGKEVDLRAYRESRGELNGDGQSRGGGSDPNPDLYGCILLAGLGLGLWIWRKTI